ncbi:MAG: pilin [Candidatus Shapirobacteria bacterium]|jgi:hypothetical protein
MIQNILEVVKSAFIAAPIYAQNIDIQPQGQFNTLGTLTFERLVSGAISLIMLVVALVFFFMLVWGGLKWVMSQGDSKNVEAARNQITNALIGLAIVFASWAIVRLIETIFGVSILNLKVPTL